MTNVSIVGRDKFLRTLQYFSRFYSWYLYRTNHPQSALAPFDAMKKQFGLTRKIMRLGKFVEHFKAAAQAADAKAMDPVLRFLAVGRQLGYAGYMLTDNLACLDQVGITKLSTFGGVKEWQRRAYQCWLAGLTCNALAGVYTLYMIRQRSLKISESGDAEKTVESKKLAKERSATVTQFVSDVCDITVPTSGLGYINFDDGIVGLAGTVSSLLGMVSVWEKTA